MKLVVSGYYGYGNAGDEAVLAGMLSSLRRERDDLDVTVLSGNPEHTERTHGIASISRSRPLALARAMRDADGLISGGGSLLQDRTSFRPVAYYAGVMRLARWLRRPYVVYAQGLGPIRRRPNRWLAATALNHAGYCSLRDEASVALARKLGVRRQIDLVPDPALALQPPSGQSGGHLLVAVRPWGTWTPYLASLRDALRELADELPIVALPMQGSTDFAASTEVIAGIGRAEVLSPDSTLDEQLAAIGSARVVIGMRLHALILAAAAGVPAVAVSYDPKVDAFAAQVGLPVVGHVAAPIDPGDVILTVRRVLAADQRPYLDRVEQLRGDLQRSAAASLSAIGDGAA
ncbi:MAG TPA: polysaccharide pyruvyl transferase CsaB [Candidatus Limnocylindrales bacterium]|nr:polysaccharide pyruvyl transferase CsaB [Candidatus Limnocylindrales bacterium]